MTRSAGDRSGSHGRLAFVLGLAAAGSGIFAFCTHREADAQRLDPRRPAAFVVGPAGGPAPTLRSDPRRSGAARDDLPGGPLRILWKKTLGLSVDHPALAGADGTIAVTTGRGDVVFLDDAGTEVAHVSSGSGNAAGPATLTSDGTVVFATTVGDVVGIRRTSARPRFVTRIGGERNARTAPLSLDDGGVVVAAGLDLVVLDAEGNVRSRVTLPEPSAAPLLVHGDRIVVVTLSGTVLGWTPGKEPVRLGSFGAPIDGGAALYVPPHSGGDAGRGDLGGVLVAVIEGNHLVELDLARGLRTTRAIAAQGLYLGPPSVRPGKGGGALVTLLALTPTRGFVVTLDPGGQEIARAPVGSHAQPLLPDGGAPPLVAPLHVGPLVDGRGGIAWVSPAPGESKVGVVTAEGAVDVIGEAICTPRGSSSSGVTGLTPFGRGSFLVTCAGGSVTRIVGPEAENLRRSTVRVTPVRPPAGAGSGSAPPPPRPGPGGDDDDDDR
ncbi:MAG: hypothetical protein JST00_47110 [Deltaproteobacteria bacterium]|nr:hypothetical protein [Deltaproteobacteria bacterium]